MAPSDHDYHQDDFDDDDYEYDENEDHMNIPNFVLGCVTLPNSSFIKLTTAQNTTMMTTASCFPLQRAYMRIGCVFAHQLQQQMIFETNFKFQI